RTARDLGRAQRGRAKATARAARRLITRSLGVPVTGGRAPARSTALSRLPARPASPIRVDSVLLLRLAPSQRYCFVSPPGETGSAGFASPLARRTPPIQATSVLLLRLAPSQRYCFVSPPGETGFADPGCFGAAASP